MKHNLVIGVFAALSSAFVYSLQTALIKTQVGMLPPLPVIIFFQSIISLILILPIIFKQGTAQAKVTMSTKRLPLHLLRCVFSIGISSLLFASVYYIPLVNAMLLSNTSPLIVPFLAYLFLSQRINHRLWLPILLGYTGVILVLHPDPRLFNPHALLALGAAVSLASTMLCVRKLSSTESTETIAFYFFLLSSIMSGLVATKFWVPLDAHSLMMLGIIGTLYFLTQMASTLSLRFANAQLVSALYYSNIIYATVLSYFIWHTLPSAMTIVGMVCIIIGGILCIRSEYLSRLRLIKNDNANFPFAKSA